MLAIIKVFSRVVFLRELGKKKGLRKKGGRKEKEKGKEEGGEKNERDTKECLSWTGVF